MNFSSLTFSVSHSLFPVPSHILFPSNPSSTFSLRFLFSLFHSSPPSRFFLPQFAPSLYLPPPLHLHNTSPFKLHG